MTDEAVTIGLDDDRIKFFADRLLEVARIKAATEPYEGECDREDLASYAGEVVKLRRALLDARAELAATQTQVGDWIVRADEANVKVEKLEAELARVKADAALAQTPTDPGDGWTWNERLGWIGPDGKPAARGGKHGRP